MKKTIITVLCTMLAITSLLAQNTVKGSVSDKNGLSIPGAMVLDKTTGRWAVTDTNGNFSLDGASKGDNIEVTCMGFTLQNFILEGLEPLAITMKDDALQLEETVVIGYGTVKKKDLTGAVGVIDNQSINQQRVTQLSQALQGSVPGLRVSRSSGMPGASASLQIRGVTSINGSEPLILVDGMAVNSLDNVATEDVEQITVLKDAASASIYGARAAAGVILVTTKNAAEGDLSISYNGEYTLNTATTWAKYLTDPINYMAMFNEYKWNDAGNVTGGEYNTYSEDYIRDYMTKNAVDPIEYPDFNWKDAILDNTSSRTKHSVSMAYGNNIVKTRVSGSYEYNDALYNNYDYNRLMARMRNTVKVSRHLSADVDFSFKRSVKNTPISVPIRAALSYPSIYLGEYPDGRVAPSKNGSNTLAVINEGGSDKTTTDYITAKFALTYTPVDDLNITAAFTPTFATTKEKVFSKAVPYYDAYDTDVLLGYVSGHQTTDLTEYRNDAQSYEFQVVANYSKEFASAHNLNIMAGYEQYAYHHESLSVGTANMELSGYPYLKLGNKDNLSTSGDAYSNAYNSFFGRAMYNYKNRYYIQGNIRADGSSRFARKYRWGVFPSGSVGWVISNEEFMKDIKPISYFKLRASLGTLGNERIGNYLYQANVDLHKSIMFDGTGSAATSQLAAAQENASVGDITWETTWTYDVGFDASFFDSRLSLTADYYYKQTKDMLLAIQIPEFTGFDSPTINAGTMHTNGWELKIDWHDRIGEVSYSVGANISDSKSIVDNLNGGISFASSETKIIKEGVEYQSWYGYRSDGIIQSREQLNGLPTQLIAAISPGDIGYKDISGADGAPDGKISGDYDRTILGSSMPHYIYGGYANVGWRGLSFGILVSGVGYQNARLSEVAARPFMSQWLASPAMLLDENGNRRYWSVYNTDEQNASAKYPRLSYTAGEKNNYEMSDFWLFDGSYFRVKNINLGYTFPSKTLKKSGIKGLKVYASVDDPFCFSHYPNGWDPEQTTSSYIARTYTFGIDLKF